MINAISKKKQASFAGIAAVLIAVVGFVVVGLSNGATEASTHTVMFTENGFSPQTLTVRQGDTVVFRTEQERNFWPASMPHLTHASYKSFDARRPVTPAGSWKFTFTKPGTWEYHDHLDADMAGTIVVEKNTSYALGECTRDMDDALLIQCWAEDIERELERGGVPGAFELFANFYDEGNPAFLANCHDYAHLIGEATFRLVVDGKDFSVTPAAAQCGFGFYHGFMETMLWTSGDFSKAVEFCESLNKKFAEIASGAAPSCYHGIGHGAAEVHDPRTWGDEEQMMEPAIGICEDVATTPQQLSDCAIGAYMAVSTFYTTGEYDLEVREDDPMWLCRRQDEVYRGACYNSMPIALMWLSDMDLYDAAQHLSALPDVYATTAVQYLAGPYIYKDLGNTDYTDPIVDCQQLRTPLVEPCLRGFPNSLKEIGGPGAEHERVFAFCESGALSAQWRRWCYEYALQTLLPPFYDGDAYAAFCRERVPVQYRGYCQMAEI